MAVVVGHRTGLREILRWLLASLEVPQLVCATVGLGLFLLACIGRRRLTELIETFLAPRATPWRPPVIIAVGPGTPRTSRRRVGRLLRPWPERSGVRVEALAAPVVQNEGDEADDEESDEGNESPGKWTVGEGEAGAVVGRRHRARI